MGSHFYHVLFCKGLLKNYALIPARAVNEMEKGRARFSTLHVFGDHWRSTRGTCGSGDMGGDGHIGVGPKGVLLGQRLVAKDIKCGMGDLPAIQCGQERLVLNQWTTAWVDDIGPFFERGQSGFKIFPLGR